MRQIAPSFALPAHGFEEPAFGNTPLGDRRDGRPINGCPIDPTGPSSGAASEPDQRSAMTRESAADRTRRGFPLAMADESAQVRVLELRGGKGLISRLTELGLNVGAELRVIQRQGGGLLVARGEMRVALGTGMAAKILVAPVA